MPVSAATRWNSDDVEVGAAADDVEVEAAVDGGGGTAVVPLAMLVGYAVEDSEMPVPVDR